MAWLMLRPIFPRLSLFSPLLKKQETSSSSSCNFRAEPIHLGPQKKSVKVVRKHRQQP
eukprot:09838.XXX_176118_176291_1 [CDS] Oithona nana genome sequencing.